MTTAPAQQSNPFTRGIVPLDKVIITHEIGSRPSREPDYRAENQALREISRCLSQSPRNALYALADQARKLCQAESAGVSIAEIENGKKIFRWHAVSGKLSSFLHGTMPRDFSPCGEVVDRRSTLLMKDMVGHYDYVNMLGMPLQEVLLVPFFQTGEPIGTIWVVSHDSGYQFCHEDRRLLESMAEFTSGIVQSYFQFRDLESQLKAPKH